MKRLIKIAVIGIVVLVLIGVVLAFSVNVDTFRPKLQAELSSALGRQVTIGKLGLSLFSGSVVADNLAIADDPAFSKDPFLTAKEVKIGVALIPLIFSRSLQITGITINTPDINLLHTPSGEWNYSTIGKNTGGNTSEANKRSGEKAHPAPTAPANPAGNSSEAKNMNLSVNALDIINGKVTVAQAHERKGIQNYNNVNLEVRNFSATSEFPIKLSAQLPGSGSLNLDGSAGPIDATDASLTPLKGKLTISSVDLAKSAYFDHSASGIEGLANIDATFNSDGKKFHSDADVKANKLRLVKGGAPANVPVALKCSVTHDLKQQNGVISNGVLGLGQTSAHFSGNYKLEPQTDISLTLTGDNMPVDQLEPLLPAVGITFPDGSKLQGGTFTANLKASGPVDHLVTTGNVKMANTTLSGFSLSSKLAAASALTGINASPDTAIKNLSSDLKIAPDGIQTSNMDLDIPTIGDVTGDGTISAANQLDYRLLAKLTGNGGGALAAVTSQTGNDLPFLVKGTTAKPIIEPDVKGLAKNKVNSVVSGFLNGNNGNNGSGNNNQNQNPVKSLKGLFGK